MTAEQLTGLITQPYRHLSKFGYDCSNGLVLAWLSGGPAVQLEFDLETDEGADDWTFWWINGGRHGCPGINEQVDRNILQTLHLNHMPMGTLLTTLPLTPLLSLVYRHREDLRQLIDIGAAGSVDQLWRWWMSSGRNTFFGSEEWLIAAEIEAIHRLDISDFRNTGIPKPTALVMLAAANSKPLPYSGTSVEVASLWAAFLSSEAKTFGLPNRGLPLIPISDSSDKSAKSLLPPSLAIIAISRPDLQAAFGRSEDASSDLIYWWFTVGHQDFNDLRDDIHRSLLRSLHIDHLPRDMVKRGLALTPLLTIIRDRRPDLQKLFDAADNGTMRLWLWWLEKGRAELFGDLDWLIDAELRSLHRLDVRSFETAGVVPLTMFAHIISGIPIDPLHEPSPTQTSVGWLEFIFRNDTSLSLPNKGVPYISHGFPDRIVRKHLAFGEIFPEVFAVIYTARQDLQKRFDWRTETGLVGLLFWWLDSGRHAYPELRQLIEDKILQTLHLQYFFLDHNGQKDKLTPLLSMLRNQRDDLRHAFDVEAVEGTRGMWLWWFSAGREQNFGPRATTLELKRFDDELPKDLATIVRSRPDLQAAFGRSEHGPSDLVYWWLTVGHKDHNGLRDEVDRSLLRLLHIDPLSRGTAKRGFALTPLMTIIRDHRPDLQRLSDDTGDGAQEFWRWWLENGRAEFFDRIDWLVEAELPSQPLCNAGGPERSVTALTKADSFTSFATLDGPNVCLIGYPKGEFGLGEDIRLLRAALNKAKIDNIVIDAPWPISARQSIDEPSIAASVANFDCNVMFYVMPPFDTVTLLTKIGPRAFSARRKIGFWQWELDRFPILASLAMHLIDEIWCHSEHTAGAFRAATEKPVVKVPLPVLVPAPRIVPRSLFGLSPDAFVVFTSFDGASAIARKNPLAAILSFQQAFPRGEIDACLIVKAMNTQNDSLWRECLRKAAIDKRIVVIDDVLDRDVYYELLRTCDAVISLHRAEGFGRLMAEAMALDIPVIASRYSGNLDFMTDDNSWLIDGEPVPLHPGDYAFHQDQRWFEPSIAEAARALQECATDPSDRYRRATLGKHTVLSLYNLKTCGKIYSDLLNRNLAS